MRSLFEPEMFLDSNENCNRSVAVAFLPAIKNEIIRNIVIGNYTHETRITPERDSKKVATLLV